MSRAKPFFETEERQAALWHAAKRWEGTPYFANAASCGHGVGCVNLMHELFVEVGAVSRMELPHYATDRGHHSTETQLLRFLLDAPQLKGRLLFVPVHGRKLAGDLVAVRSGRLDHHLAMNCGFGKVIHAMEEIGAVIVPDDDERLTRRVLYTLRIMEKSE